MSDRKHDSGPDPVDKAYREAEALLSDEAARAARRARVLAAVAQQGAPSAPLAKRSPLRRGGWLVAASVAAFGLFMAAQLYRPFPPRPPKLVAPPPAVAPGKVAASTLKPQSAPAPPASIAAPPATPTGSAPPVGPARLQALRQAPAPSPAAVAPGRAAQAAAPPPAEQGPAAARPAAPAPGANQSPAAGGVAKSEAGDVQELVTGEKRESRRQSGPAISAFTSSQRDVVGIKPGERQLAPEARLLAAAAAGRTDEVEALLDEGAAVDSADLDGDTPLIKSVEGDHPDTAAALRRHGANLRHRNHAGESAEDLAGERGDPQLDQALGIRP